MPLPTATTRALTNEGVVFLQDVEMVHRTFWRAGGTTDGVAYVADLPALQLVQQIATETNCPLLPLGRASNVLVSDAGIRGLVIYLTGALAKVVSNGNIPPIVTAGAGMGLTSLLAQAKKHRWTGLECFAGIPGTVGGAICSNAGTVLGHTADILVDAQLVMGPKVQVMTKNQLQMGYRSCQMPEGAIIASARLQTTKGDFAQSSLAMKGFIHRRKVSQPTELPNCGSTFRNPPGDYAGRLIDEAGLRGFAIGNAAVSEKHANFVVNRGSASASEIRMVIEHIQRVVEERFGVTLRREVRFVGDWASWEAR